MRQPGRVSLRDLFSVLFRDKWRIISVVLVSLAAASVYLMMQSSIYVADSRILVRIGKEKLAGIEPYASTSHNIVFQERGQDIFNEIQILRDPEVTRRVYARLRSELQPPPPPDGGLALLRYRARAIFADAKSLLREPLYWLGLSVRQSEEMQVVLALHNALVVEAVEDTDVLKVSFGWPDPVFAARALNVFVEEFIAMHLQVTGNEQSEPFYRQQIAIKQHALDTASAELVAYRLEHDLSHLPTQLDRTLQEIAEIDASLRGIELTIEGFAALRRGVERARESQSEWVQTPEFAGRAELNLDVLDREYFDLVAQRSLLASVHQDDAREMVILDERIGRLRDRKAGALIEYFRMNAGILAEQRDALRGTRDALNTRLREINQAAARLATLERNVEIAEQGFVLYRTKAEELRVSDELNRSLVAGVRVFSEAKPPLAPSYPRRGLVLALAAAVGLFLGIALSAIAEYFNHSFRGPEDVEQVLGVPLMMSVPTVRT